VLDSFPGRGGIGLETPREATRTAQKYCPATPRRRWVGRTAKLTRGISVRLSRGVAIPAQGSVERTAISTVPANSLPAPLGQPSVAALIASNQTDVMRRSRAESTCNLRRFPQQW